MKRTYGKAKCRACGEEYTKTNPTQTYCTPECRTVAYNASRRRDHGKAKCRACGEEFEKVNSGQVYCSRLCKTNHENYLRRVKSMGECRQCGERFVVDTEHKVYCPECKDKADPVQEARTRQERQRTEQEIKTALLDERNRTQVLDALIAASDRVKGWTPKNFNINLGKKFAEEHANIIFSDWHSGEKITLEESGGLAEYNMAIQRERLEKCVTSIAEIVNIQNEGGIPIKHCNIHLLGDIITQEKIYKGQDAYIDAYTADQVVYSKNLLGEVLLNLLDVFKTIDVDAIPGNHGRMGEKGEGPTWNNFDYLTYLWTQDLLSDYRQIQWRIPRSWFYTKDVLGWRFCGAHGDDVKMYQRTPFYGLERDANDMAAMLWDLEQHPPNYFLYAHFHTHEEAEISHGERIMNGSVVGGSMLSVKAMKKKGRPSQTYFQVSKKKGITARYPLWLEKPRKRD